MTKVTYEIYEFYHGYYKIGTAYDAVSACIMQEQFNEEYGTGNVTCIHGRVLTETEEDGG